MLAVEKDNATTCWERKTRLTSNFICMDNKMRSVIYKILVRLSTLVYKDPKKCYDMDPIRKELISRHWAFL